MLGWSGRRLLDTAKKQECKSWLFVVVAPSDAIASKPTALATCAADRTAQKRRVVGPQIGQACAWPWLRLQGLDGILKKPCLSNGGRGGATGRGESWGRQAVF